MGIALAIAVATLGVATAVAHSIIGERKILRPLYAERPAKILASRKLRAIIRAVFHMPSVTWAALGIAVLAARFQNGNGLVGIIAIAIFALSGTANLVALRRLHPGGLMLLAAAALTIADSIYP